jgi:hypothetical protein
MMQKIIGKKGMRVKIYQKPVSKEDYEGEATLVEFLGKADFPPYEEDWMVKFNGEVDTYQRMIIF